MLKTYLEKHTTALANCLKLGTNINTAMRDDLMMFQTWTNLDTCPGPGRQNLDTDPSLGCTNRTVLDKSCSPCSQLSSMPSTVYLVSYSSK